MAYDRPVDYTMVTQRVMYDHQAFGTQYSGVSRYYYELIRRMACRSDMSVSAFQGIHINHGPMRGCLTSTFHGSSVSLKYRKEFIYLKNEKARNWVVSLAEICDLSDAFARSEANVELIRPDYDAVEARLTPLIDFFRNWLKEAIELNVDE